MAGVRLVDDHLTCVLSCGCARRTLVSRWKGRWRWLLLLWLLWPWLSLLAGLAQLRNEDEWFTSSSGEFLLSSGRSEEYGGLGRRQLYTRFRCCWTDGLRDDGLAQAYYTTAQEFTYKSGSKTQESRNK
uniref:Beta-amylase n=1 Tax=Oryza glumipatula TaxID=40148 RepID=A0A0D9YJN4_9ORYZ